MESVLGLHVYYTHFIRINQALFFIFFKKSFIFHPAAVFGIYFLPFWEQGVHSHGDLRPGQIFYVIEPEHDPYLTFGD